MPVMTQEEALAEFRERMIGEHSGGTRVVDVRYRNEPRCTGLQAGGEAALRSLCAKIV